jgi:hypothetical protein
MENENASKRLPEFSYPTFCCRLSLLLFPAHPHGDEDEPEKDKRKISNESRAFFLASPQAQ